MKILEGSGIVFFFPLAIKIAESVVWARVGRVSGNKAIFLLRLIGFMIEITK